MVKPGSTVSLPWGIVGAGALLVILAAAVLLMTRDIKSDAASIRFDAVPGLVQANILRSTFAEEFAWTLRAFDKESPDSRAAMQRQVSAFDESARVAIETYGQTMQIDPATDAALLARLLNAREDYVRTRIQMAEALDGAASQDIEDTRLDQLSSAFKKLTDAADALVTYNANVGAEYARQMGSTASTLRWSALGIICVVGLALFLNAKSIARSLQIQREIHQEQAKLAAAFRVSPYTMAISRRRDGRMVAVNDAFRRHYGIGQEILTGRTAVEMGVWNSGEEREQVLSEVERTGRLTNYMKRGRSADGAECTLLISAEPISLDGEPCLLAVGQDVTELVKAQESLARSEAELRVVFVNAGVGMALVNSKGQPIRVNPALENMLGYSAAELTAMHLAEFTHTEDRVRDGELFRRLISGELDTYRIEKRYVHKDGGSVWANLTVSVQRQGDDQGPLVIGMIEDITQRRKAEQALQQSERQRRELQHQLNLAHKLEALGQLSGGVAHDFNNMIAAIMLHLDVMRMEKNVPHSIRGSIDELMTTARRAAGLTRQLLLFSRREPTNRRVLDFRLVIGNLLAMLKRLIGSNFELVANQSGDPLWVLADSGMLEQVVLNLVVNARDAMPRGGRITLETDLVEVDAAEKHHSKAKAGRHVRFTVTDTGTGMSEELMERIFEPFFTTKDQGKGTGLGLSTVFGIVEQHQGWIDVQSSVGRGSSFTLFIPAQAAPVALTEQTVTSVAPLSGHGRILVADDNEQLRVITARILRNAGYEVIEARDGITAREALKDANGSIDLLLSDVVMPGGIMGDELARDAQIRPGTKIILMSASVENLDLAAFEASGGSYLSKPFDTQQLLAAVRSKLDPMAVSG